MIMEKLMQMLTIEDENNNEQRRRKYKRAVASTSKMAIKNLAIESEDSKVVVDLEMIAQYIEAMSNTPTMLMQPAKLLMDCREVVRALANSEIFLDDQTWYYLQVVESFMMQAVSVHPDVRQMVISATMNQLFMIISDPDTTPSAFAALVLVMFDSPNMEMTDSIRTFVDEATATASLELCLANLYRWCYEWQPNNAPLGLFVHSYLQVLEEKQRYDVLMTVSMDHIERLFLVLHTPSALRQSMSNLLFHVLAACRYSIPVLDKIAPHVGPVLASLAADSSQWSRTLLQHVVDVMAAIIENLNEVDKRAAERDAIVKEAENGEDANRDENAVTNEDPDAIKTPAPVRIKYKDQYAFVIRLLERHMASGDCPFLTKVPWQINSFDDEIEEPRPQTKAGLHNLGNTCYMNSVLQALLATKQFSNTVILYKEKTPYWSRLCQLFTKMHHSLSCKLNPLDLYQIIKPPYFIGHGQHDSSEFLVYMFETLQCYEYHTEHGFDYNNPPPRVIPSYHNMTLPAIMENDYYGAGSSNSGHRSVSPMPGSSSSSSGSTGVAKRGSSSELDMPLKKRLRREPKDRPGKAKNKAKPFHCNSILDQLFGGVLVTRLQCIECGAASFSRDLFRDLQLGFPEKLENKQLSVQYLIEYYCSEERLCGDNRYRCPSCKELQEAERSVVIETSPKYLIVVLKNFRYEPKLQVNAKLMLEMHYDMTITLPTKGTHEDRPQYNLYAGVVHSGCTLDSGHYFTLAHDGNQWHEYNDEVVLVSSEDQINQLKNTCTPYILFYRRTDVDEPEPPTFEELCPSLRQMVESHNKHVVEVVNQFKTQSTLKP